MPKKSVEYEEAKRSGRWLWVVSALLIGALIGWTANESANDKNKGNPGSNTSSQSSTQENISGTVSLTSALGDYTQMLVEAGREGVDAPSDEARAAKISLTSKTDTLVKSLNQSGLFKETDEIKVRLDKVNEAFLTYASTARSEDNKEDFDQALVDLGMQIKDDAKDIKNLQELLASLNRYKNTVLESIQSFADGDYQGSYDKQLQAESQAAKIIDLLKK